MTEFERLFEQTGWGWRMRGHTDHSSPVTLWQCAGVPTRFQVNVNRWVISEHMNQGVAEAVAVAHAEAM